MRPVKISKWPTQMLDHQIMLIERRAEIWARIFQTTLVDFLPPRYVQLVEERLLR